MDERTKRAARNENAFRLVNERVESLAGDADVVGFVCECARIDCVERLDVPLDEYEQVRRHPARFFVAPGHEDPRVELVVDERRRYLVVEKVGEAGELAEEADPRGP